MLPPHADQCMKRDTASTCSAQTCIYRSHILILRQYHTNNIRLRIWDSGQHIHDTAAWCPWNLLDVQCISCKIYWSFEGIFSSISDMHSFKVYAEYHKVFLCCLKFSSRFICKGSPVTAMQRCEICSRSWDADARNIGWGFGRHLRRQSHWGHRGCFASKWRLPVPRICCCIEWGQATPRSLASTSEVLRGATLLSDHRNDLFMYDQFVSYAFP